MRHTAEQFSLPMQVEQTVERESVTCDCQQLADALHNMERSGWRVVALDKLPANIGYRLECERKGQKHDRD